MAAVAPITTERLLLRGLRHDDARAFAAVFGDPEVMRYVEPPLSPEDVAACIAAGARHARRFGTQHWAVALRGSGAVIGCCGLNRYEGGPDYELAYHFARAYWGRGYATEAARAALELGFGRFGVPRIVASIHPEHDGSRRVLVKLGFRELGLWTCPDSGLQEPFFALSAAEWRAQR